MAMVSPSAGSEDDGGFVAEETPDRLETGEDVRLWIAREIHDGAAQTLAEMVVRLEECKSREHDRDAVAAELAELQEATRDVLRELRGIVSELRGAGDQGQDLTELIRALLERVEAKDGVSTRLVVEDWAGCAPAAVSNLYRVVEQAVRNAVTDGGADAVLVVLGRAAEQSVVQVIDNGTGAGEALFGAPGRFGVLGMRERAVLLGGQLQIQSAENAGTIVTVLIPTERLVSGAGRQPRPLQPGG